MSTENDLRRVLHEAVNPIPRNPNRCTEIIKRIKKYNMHRHMVRRIIIFACVTLTVWILAIYFFR